MAADEVHVWEWPDALDALSAEPKNHRFLFENDEDVRLLATSVRPGKVVATHTTSALAPHVLENVGDTEIRVLHFEVKR